MSQVAGFAGAGRMAIVTWGSSGCPGLPDRLDVPTSSQLTVTVKADLPAMASCPADLAPTTSVIQVPSTLSRTGQVSVTIVDGSYGATVSLAPRPAGG